MFEIWSQNVSCWVGEWLRILPLRSLFSLWETHEYSLIIFSSSAQKTLTCLFHSAKVYLTASDSMEILIVVLHFISSLPWLLETGHVGHGSKHSHRALQRNSLFSTVLPQLHEIYILRPLQNTKCFLNKIKCFLFYCKERHNDTHICSFPHQSQPSKMPVTCLIFSENWS